MLRKSIFFFFAASLIHGKIAHAPETQKCSHFPGMTALVLQWLWECYFLLDRLPGCFCFPSPAISHVPHFFLLFPCWCCWISNTVCSCWDPPSAAARHGQAAWGLWLPLLEVVSKWIQDFLAHSFPTSSKTHFCFDTYLWTPFSYTHFHPLDEAHFSGQGFYFS